MRPLLSFCLFTYNQREFVAEAVHAALAQTYVPLEIIISDDASTDETFAIAEEVVRNYQGPHRIRLNRNSPNLGLATHVSKVLEMAQGELCVMGAGDDVSEPERVEALFAVWDATGRQAAGIFSNTQIIDASGRNGGLWCKFAEACYPKSLHELLSTLTNPVLGCSCAYRREAIVSFGPIPPKVVREDKALGVRVVSSGGYIYLNRPLVRYRRHGGNTYRPTRGMWALANHFDSVRYVAGEIAIIEMWMADLEKSQQGNLIASYGMRGALHEAKIELRLRTSDRLSSAWIAIRELCRGVRAKRVARWFVQYAICRGAFAQKHAGS